MCDLDTIEWISTLCNADRRPFLSELLRRVTVGQLQQLYLGYVWIEECKKAILAMGEGFQKAFEEMYERFTNQFSERNSLGMIDDYLKSIEWLPISNPRWKRKWCYSDKWNEIRKDVLTQTPHRLRCRWRQRESRRSLEGLSPVIVVIDEEVE